MGQDEYEMRTKVDKIREGGGGECFGLGMEGVVWCGYAKAIIKWNMQDALGGKPESSLCILIKC